jgi:hypothetical protein
MATLQLRWLNNVPQTTRLLIGTTGAAGAVGTRAPT